MSFRRIQDLDPQETFHCALRGFSELVCIEPVLEKFQHTLFSESTKTFNRDLETAQSVETLDTVIAEFLRLVSPYFLLHPSHKCLQWLMHAFEIHTYNTDALMECVLPYYQSTLFSRLVNQLKLSNESRWYWLCETSKLETTLSSATLVKWCTKKKWLLKFVCEMVMASLKTHKKYGCVSKGVLKNLFSLYCCTVVSIIEDNRNITETFLLSILPYILKGLKSSHHDFKCSTMMIIGMLGVKAALNKELIDTLLSSLKRVSKTSLAEEAMLCAKALSLTLPDEYLTDKYPALYTETGSSEQCQENVTETDNKEEEMILIETKHTSSNISLVNVMKTLSDKAKDELVSNSTITSSLEQFVKHLTLKKYLSKRSEYESIIEIVLSLIEEIPPPANLSTDLWLNTPTIPINGSTDTHNLYYYLVVSIFKFSLIITEQDGQRILEKLLTFHFAGKGSLLRFLAMIWNASHLSCGSLITRDLQVHALTVTAAYIQSMDALAIVALTASSCPVIPSLLLGIGSHVRLVRKGCLNCMKLLHNASCQNTLQSEPMSSFLEAIIASERELQSDEYAIILFLEKYFCTPTSQRKVSKSKKAKTTSTREDAMECLINWFSSLWSLKDQRLPYHVMVQFLVIFREVDTEKKLLLLLPSLESVIIEIQKAKKELITISDQSLFEVLCILVSCYTPATASGLSRESPSFNVLLDLLSINDTSFLPVSPSVLVIKQIIIPEFYKSIDSECQQCLFKRLLDMLLESKVSTTTSLIKRCLQNLPFSSVMIIEEFSGIDSLTNNQQTNIVDSTPSRKRQRKSKATRPPLTFNRIAAVLEIVHCTHNHTDLLFVPTLFKVLSLCLNVDGIVNSPDMSLVATIEYIQQLVMDILFSIYEAISKSDSQDEVTEDLFNIELLIQTLQTSSNIKIQNSILLLLSTALSVFPARNIHNIMPVFAFIGQSLSKQDNEVTFDVITRTISAIMPSLVKHSTQKVTHRRRSSPQLDPVLSTVTDVFRVMVDSLPHIPHHRCLPLLTHLVSVVDPAMYLHVMLGLLVAKCVTSSSDPKSSFDGWADTRFLVSLSEFFSCSVQLCTMSKLLEYIMALPNDKPDASESRRIPATKSFLFNSSHHSHKQLKQFRYAVLCLLSAIAGNIRLDDNNNGNIEITEAVERIIQFCLEYLIIITEVQTTVSDVVSTKYWEAIAKKVQSVCEKIASILQFEAFLNTLYKLMNSDNSGMQWRAMKILNKINEKSSDMFTKKEEQSLLKLVKLLEDVSTSSSTSSLERQTALYGIKLIVARVDRKSKAFSKTAKSLVKLLSDKSLDSLVKSNTFLCIAELCQYMNVDMIKLLPRIMPHLLASIDQSNSYLCLSSLASLSIIIKNVPTVSSFLQDILAKTCAITSNEVDSSSEIVAQAKSIRTSIGELFPPRVLYPIIHKTIPTVIIDNKKSTLAVIDVFEAIISRIQKQDIKTSIPTVSEIFMMLFEYRSKHNHVSDHGDILNMEERVNTVFCEFAMKLSEISFKPLFTRIFEWAREDGLTSDKIITFCHLVKCISKGFKSLFLLFVNPFVTPFGKIIDLCYRKKDQGSLFTDSNYAACNSKASLTLNYILDTLTTCFLYDSQQLFVTKETFQILLCPLINQISNTDDESYQELIEHHLAPCLSQLAVAAGKDSLFKKMNHDLLMKTRDNNSKVRFSSLLVIQQLYERLGEEMSVLLPETIPFLSELLEDDSLEVEKQVKTTIAMIEKVTGESVQQYF